MKLTLSLDFWTKKATKHTRHQQIIRDLFEKQIIICSEKVLIFIWKLKFANLGKNKIKDFPIYTFLLNAAKSYDFQHFFAK